LTLLAQLTPSAVDNVDTLSLLTPCAVDTVDTLCS